MRKLPTSYQVWVLGYNNEDCITDFNEFLGEFQSGSEATKYAESLSLSDLKDKLERILHPFSLIYLSGQTKISFLHIL